jgi:hypothetical protein
VIPLNYHFVALKGLKALEEFFYFPFAETRALILCCSSVTVGSNFLINNVIVTVPLVKTRKV